MGLLVEVELLGLEPLAVVVLEDLLESDDGKGLLLADKVDFESDLKKR